MPSRVPEAQPLVSDEADESEAFASLALALGKKIDCEGARFWAPSFMARKGVGKTAYEGVGSLLWKGRAVEIMVCYKVLSMRLFSCKCAKSFETACKA